ncbi:MAG: DUF362 domain-containing protein, partial [Clostridia bacterium]|nr:DUF362 domain-containing protein [Clostridia bacterium]
EMVGIGGVLKNLGMGCGSTEGKRRMHNEGKPAVDEESCVGCGRCAAQCAHEAILYREEKKGRKAFIDTDKCAGCGRCVGVCGIHGALVSYEGSEDMISKKISEYALAVVQGKPHFHISVVMDVTPFCDCHGGSDSPIIANVGMFAGFDPVALDMACADACNHMEPLPGTYLTDREAQGRDLFGRLHPSTNWRIGVEHAQKIGLGTTHYELIEV